MFGVFCRRWGALLDADGLDEGAALLAEYAHGKLPLATETSAGAARFTAGAGRHGAFPDDASD